MKCDELKPLLFSLNELAFIDESAVQKDFENPHDHAVYKATEVDAAIAELKQKLQDQCISCPVKMQEDDVVADLKERHKMEVEQLLMKIAGLEKLVEIADNFVKQKGGFTVKDISFDGVKLEGMKND